MLTSLLSSFSCTHNARLELQRRYQMKFAREGKPYNKFVASVFKTQLENLKNATSILAIRNNRRLYIVSMQ